LVLNSGRVVPTTQLIDDVWGDEPPPTAAHAIETYVFRLRGLLRSEVDGDVILTRPPGYLLRVDPERVDVARFERLAADGEAALAEGQADRAAELLRAADDLWRGSALADVWAAPFAVAAASRLDDRRLVAQEKRIDADLRLGRHRELIHELEALTAAHPYRESLCGQLMTALYRSGRQADALAAFRRTRMLLVNDLGIEPAPVLQRLEQAILRQDAELEQVAGVDGDRRLETPLSRRPASPSPVVEPPPKQAGRSGVAERRRWWQRSWSSRWWRC
jgi:DNA-binding SARP family transcriptional activator